MASRVGSLCAVVVCAAIGVYFAVGVVHFAYAMYAYSSQFTTGIFEEQARFIWTVLKTNAPFTLPMLKLQGPSTGPYQGSWHTGYSIAVWVGCVAVSAIAVFRLWPRQTAKRQSGDS